MKKRSIILCVLVALIIVTGIVVALTHPAMKRDVLDLFQLRTITELRTYVHSLGVWGPIIVILMMILHSVTFIPSEVLTISSVVLFGPVWGVIYAWIGSMLGAYLAFFLARWFGRSLVDRFVPTRALEKFDQFMANRGALGILILRLIPLVSFNALNYASGLTTLTLWQFTWTTGVGILPATLLIALLYQSAAGQKYALVAMTAVGVLALLGLTWRSRIRKRAEGQRFSK